MKKQLREIKQLLEVALKGKVTTFYIGKPRMIPETALNALYVEPITDTIILQDSIQDLHRFEFAVGVAIRKDAKTDSLNDKSNDKLLMIEIMQGNNDTDEIQSNSVVGTLRKKNQADNITGGISFEDNEMVVNYETVIEDIDSTLVYCREARFTLTFIDNVTT